MFIAPSVYITMEEELAEYLLCRCLISATITSRMPDSTTAVYHWGASIMCSQVTGVLLMPLDQLSDVPNPAFCRL